MLEEKIKELEKLGKPIVHCKDYWANLHWNTGYEIQFVNKKDEVRTYKYSFNAEEKDDILITDDFIFVKESE